MFSRKKSCHLLTWCRDKLEPPPVSKRAVCFPCAAISPEHSWNTATFESVPSELTARNCCTKPRGGALTMTCGTWMKCKTYYKLSFLVNDMFEYNPERADSQHSVWKWKGGSEVCWLFMCMHLLRHCTASLVPSACLLWIFIHKNSPITVDCWISNEYSYEATLSLVCVSASVCVWVWVCLCTVRYRTRHSPATANRASTCLFYIAEVVCVRLKSEQFSIPQEFGGWCLF